MRRPACKAGVAYFAAVFLVGFVLGVVRNLGVAPRLGETLAVAIELPLVLAFAWFACGWILRRFELRDTLADGVVMGAVAFMLLMIGELSISVLIADRGVADHLALYRHAPQLLGLSGQVAFAVFPAVRLRAAAKDTGIWRAK